MPNRRVSGLLGTTQRSIARLQWQPTLTAHDPNPPLTLESSVGAITLIADSGVFSWTGTAASLLYNRLVAAAGGVYTWTGTAATLSKIVTLVAAAGSYSEVGTAASLLYNRLVAANTVAYALSGSDASLLRALLLVANSASYVHSGSVASTLYNRAISGETVAFVWTGTSVTFNYNQPEQGAGTTGYAIILSGAGATRIGALGGY